MTNETMYFEKLVLAKLIKFPELRNEFMLEPIYFEDERHGNIANMIIRNQEFTYEDLLSSAVESPEVYGGYDFVNDIASIDIIDIVNPRTFKKDQEKTLENYKLREIDKKIKEYQSAKSPETVQGINAEIQRLSKLAIDHNGKKTEVLKDMFESLFEDNSSPIIKTDFTNLDNLIDGIEMNQLNIIAARPSMGKTTFALQMAMNIQTDETEVIFCSAETTEKVVTRRILSNLSGVPLNKFKNPTALMTIEDIDKVTAAIGLYSKMNINIVDDAAFTPNKIRSLVQGMNDDTDKIVFIDYMQLMSSDNRKNNRYEEVSEISRELKILSNEIPNLTIIALSQLSRAVETRNDKRPNMSDLRESGQIEQDANMIMFLYRDDYYNRDEETDDNISEVEVIVGKNKDGPQGIATVTFYKDTQRMY
ncbi:replicative DNA helicase [Jeotgalicoccus aerolatus]|uniref:Replicative DNA helicase n=1 Tax=Jeotgalicoccus aerolatus TaxID=709510 RepID=A0A1G9BS73_9STAP|nr:DnaB helicase C-terminal domain-containing protein [Jeotgalicoccus aerolatus]SDK42351.1 replicative DNA helicase [Jeotgalicoccus aerolatus]